MSGKKRATVVKLRKRRANEAANQGGSDALVGLTQARGMSHGEG